MSLFRVEKRYNELLAMKREDHNKMCHPNCSFPFPGGHCLFGRPQNLLHIKAVCFLTKVSSSLMACHTIERHKGCSASLFEGLRCLMINTEKSALVISHSKAHSIWHDTGINLLLVGGCKSVLLTPHKCQDLNSSHVTGAGLYSHKNLDG